MAERQISRRTFLDRTAAAVAGAAVPMTALSYGRVAGANNRIMLGHVGVGNRGRGLEWITAQLSGKMNAEVTAVCDLWKVNRERAVEAGKKYYGRPPRSTQRFDELLELKDLDGIFISTPEHQHSPMLKRVAEAGKHAYCEKPMGNVLEEAKAARDAVLSRNLIVQIGTQRRSEPYQVAAQKLFRTGDMRRGQQGGSGVELPRAAVARPSGSEADPRGRHRLARVADDQTVPAV